MKWQIWILNLPKITTVLLKSSILVKKPPIFIFADLNWGTFYHALFFTFYMLHCLQNSEQCLFNEQEYSEHWQIRRFCLVWPKWACPQPKCYTPLCPQTPTKGHDLSSHPGLSDLLTLKRCLNFNLWLARCQHFFTLIGLN